MDEDAYGRTGVRQECWTCNGSGMEYAETCVVCGGYGWINEPEDLPTITCGGIGVNYSAGRDGLITFP